MGLALAVPGFADVVSGAGAGSLPFTALDLTGDPNPTEITGALDTTNPDLAAMFEIHITHPEFFSATTIDPGAFGIPDPELFLFDSLGNGVYENDDTSGGNQQACLPSSSTIGNPCPATSSLGPLSVGNYFLAITISQNSPVDGANNEIFSPVLSTDVVGPNSGVGRIEGWDGGFFTSPDFDNVNYDIIISDSPEPAAWPVTLALGLGLVFFRRKLRTR